MALMTFPESLRKDFEVLDSYPNGGILAGYHVRERRFGGRELLLRLLPEAFCRDKGLVESFHEFFARFTSISNKSYTPQVYSVSGAVNGPVYVLEEYVPGISLTGFVKKKGISSDFNREFIEVLSKVCEALHHAHQKDIYHLCITPEDIIVDELTGRVKLVGFGTQIFAQIDKTGLLPEEAKKHIPPEVSHGKALGPTADIYSLATAITEVCPEVFADTEVLYKALSDDPTERYQSARDLERSLNDVLEDIEQATRSKTLDTPMEAKGGLKPVFSQKVVSAERDLSERQDQKIGAAPQHWLNNQSMSPKSISMKLVAGIAAGLIALAAGLALYFYHNKQILEKDLQIAQIREADQRAALEKERIEKEKQEKEAEIAKRKEAQRQADLYKEQLEKEKQEKEKLKAEQENNQREKEEKERLLKQEQERVAKEERDKERAILKEKEEQNRQEQQKRQWERQQREREEKERLERERQMEQERQRRNQEKQNAFIQKLNQIVRSIEKGSSAARREISNLCRSPETMDMIRTAANNGNADAQFILGRAYHMGDGISIDYNMAIYWYTKSAEQQNAAAECNLGYIYHDEKGVPRDRSKARDWFTRAAQHGDTDAKRMLRNHYGD
jgi:hypothetical protein